LKIFKRKNRNKEKKQKSKKAKKKRFLAYPTPLPGVCGVWYLLTRMGYMSSWEQITSA
jgi:hypothetical protein